MRVRCLGSRCFSSIMIAHVILWMYLCFGSPSTYSLLRARELPVQTPPPIQQPPTNLMKDERVVDTLQLYINHIKHASSNQSLARQKKTSITPDTWERYFDPVLGHTILSRDPSVALYGKFVDNPATLCTRHADLDLVAVVHSSPYNFQRRNRIRRTLAHPSTCQPYTVQFVFILGTYNSTTKDEEKEKILQKEIEKYRDFVRIDFQENFRNLSLKAVTWLRWLNEHCPNAGIVLKIDDDVVIDMRRILPLSRGLFTKYKRSIFCNLNKIGYQPIPRIGRTQVDPREFAGLAFYPYNYCSGFVVLLSRDLIPALFTALKRTPFYNVDDVFMFGMVPKMIGQVRYFNLGFNISIWQEKVYNCTIKEGTACRYFATMAQRETEAGMVWSAMERGHRSDFRFPYIMLA